jgi:hypothetical protein
MSFVATTPVVTTSAGSLPMVVTTPATVITPGSTIVTAECMNYNVSFYDFFTFRKEFLYVLCESSDHTKLILTSTVRLLIYCAIFYILYKNNIASYDLKRSSIQILLFMLGGIMIFINCLYLLIVLAKKPSIDPLTKAIIADTIATQLNQNKISSQVTEPALTDPNAVSFDVTSEALSQIYVDYQPTDATVAQVTTSNISVNDLSQIY